MRLKSSLVVVSLAVLLGACSGNPEEKVADMLEEGESVRAIEWLSEELADTPKDPLLNGLAAEVKVRHCLATRCYDTSPALLEQVTGHLRHVGRIVKTEDGQRDVYGNILAILKPLPNRPNHPAAMTAVLEALPDNAPHNGFIDLALTTASDHLKNIQIPPASAMLITARNLAPEGDLRGAFAGLLASLVNNDAKGQMEALKVLESVPETQTLSETFIESLPYALYLSAIQHNSASGTNDFLTSLRHRLLEMNIPPLSQNKTLARMANVVYAMPRNPTFMEDALNHTTFDDDELGRDQVVKQDKPVEADTPAPATATTTTTSVSATAGVSATVAVSTTREVAQAEETAVTREHVLSLRLLKGALLLNPRNPSAWESFLRPAMDYVDKTGNTSLLFADLAPNDIPETAIEPYNRQLFALMDRRIQSGRSIIELIDKVIVSADTADAIRARAAKTLKRAMDEAITTENFDLIYAYAKYDPEIARFSRQKVVGMTINALEKRWRNNDFASMDELATFLTDAMGIDFSLNSLLLQNFEDDMEREGLVKKLSSDTPQSLLVPEDEAHLDLGPKFTYLRKHFKDTPAILDNILKAQVVEADGSYGVPNALYRLFPLFDDNDFPLKDRKAYLTNAIKNSLSQDDNLDALEMADIGFKIHKAHPDVPLLFIVSETLRRLDDTETSRKLWDTAPKELKQAIGNAQPQFVALMEALDAYESGDKQKAADMFTVLTDPQYVNQAKPYLKEYLTAIEGHQGVYLANTVEGDLPTLLVSVELMQQGGTDNIDPAKDLLGVNLTLINAVGSVVVTSPQTLTEDYGKVFKYTLSEKVNPNTHTITIPEEKRTGAGLPLSFERIFGDIRKLSFKDGKLLITNGNNTTSHTFNKVADNPEAEFFPNGRYGITTQVSDSDTATAHILPVGSIVDIKTNRSKPLHPVKNGKRLAVIYPVTGSILHPAATEPRPLEGFYSAEHHTVSLSYSYPLAESGTLEAALRCQMVEAYLVCAGHNKNWSRQRYSHVVTGRKAKGGGNTTYDQPKTQAQPQSQSSAKPATTPERTNLLPEPALDTPQ